MIRLLHPFYDADAYLISTIDGRMYNIKQQKYEKRSAKYLFSSLFCPLPSNWKSMFVDNKLYVSEPRKRYICHKSKKGFMCNGIAFKTKEQQQQHKWTDRRIFTEACMTVARPVLIISQMCGELETNETLMMTLVSELKEQTLSQ